MHKISFAIKLQTDNRNEIINIWSLKTSLSKNKYRVNIFYVINGANRFSSLPI